MQKKKAIYLISGVITIAVIGIIAYFVWPKNKSVENKTETKSQQEEKVKQLKSQLTQIRNELNKPENSAKKVKHLTQLTEIENKLKNLSQQNNQEQTIQELEQNIKTIDQELKIPEKPDDSKQDQPTKNPETPEENSDCPYLNETNLTTFDSKKMSISNEELAQWKEVPHSYIVSLWRKGYHWRDILQLWEWKIPELETPDLKTEKRVGVINELGVIHNPDRLNKNLSEEERQRLDNHAGSAQSLVVIMRKIPGGEPIINVDKGQTIIPNYKKNPVHNTKKIIKLFLEQEKINPIDYQICVLDSLEAENFNREDRVSFGKGGGKSSDSAVYLALLSAYHQKPISHSVATTGALWLSTRKGKINQQEFTIQSGTNLPILGLKWKIQAATKKGVDHLVLSKYQTAPLLSSWDEDQKKWIQNEEDYQTVVPTETKAKIKEIHWAENIQDLRDLVLQGKLF